MARVVALPFLASTVVVCYGESRDVGSDSDLDWVIVGLSVLIIVVGAGVAQVVYRIEMLRLQGLNSAESTRFLALAVNAAEVPPDEEIKEEFPARPLPRSIITNATSEPPPSEARLSGVTVEEVQDPQGREGLKYQRGALIGRGAFGEVYQAIIQGTGQCIAVKCINLAMGKADAGPFLAEAEMMQRFSHRNITRYLGAEYDAKERKVNLFMEYVDGGSLAALVRSLSSRLDESIAAHYTRQLVEGLSYLHSVGVLHRDIKGENVLFTTAGVVKLADFGCSKSMQEVRTKTFRTLGGVSRGCDTMVGTPYWMAPEVISARGQGSVYGPASDVWSVGCTVSEILNKGAHPWPVFENVWQTVFFIWEHEGLPPNIPQGLSPEAFSFIVFCLARNPKDRPTTAELLNHSFIKDVSPTETEPP